MKWKMITNILGGLFLLALMIFATYMVVPFVRYLSIPVTGGTQAPPFKESSAMVKLKAANQSNYFNTSILGNTSEIVSSIKDVPEQGGWINTAPLDLHALAAQGYTILVLFGNYNNLNTYLTLPAIKDIWQKYKDHGLVVVSVPSPQFNFEKDPAYLLSVIRANKITYPVVTDGEKQIWNKFGNYRRPAIYLIDTHGEVVYTQFGEGNYAKLDEAIRNQLQKAGWALPSALSDNYLQVNQQKIQTPTLYVGTNFIRRRLGNSEQPEANKTVNYLLPKELKENYLYVQGSWLAKPDYMQAQTAGVITVIYLANSVYLVLDAVKKPLKVEIQLDQAPIPKNLRGKNIVEQNGKTYIEITEPGLYFPLQDHAPYTRHQLTILTPAGLRLYAIDFTAW